MPWGAAIVAGGAIAGSVISSNAAGDAADAQSQAAKDANAAQLAMHNQTRADLAPYSSAGTNALTQMTAANNGDYSGFLNSPDYKFAQQQGIAGMDASAASRGNLYSGGYGKDLVTYSNGLASQQYGQYYNRLAGLVGIGENAAAGQGNSNQAYANAYGNNATNAGQAQAQGALGQASVWNNGINQLAKLGGQYASSYGHTGDPNGYNLDTGGTPATDFAQYNTSPINSGTFNFANAGTGVGR